MRRVLSEKCISIGPRGLKRLWQEEEMAKEGTGQVQRRRLGKGGQALTATLDSKRGQSAVGGDTVAGWAGSNPRLGCFRHFQILARVNRRSLKRTKQRKNPWAGMRRMCQRQQGWKKNTKKPTAVRSLLTAPAREDGGLETEATEEVDTLRK